MVQIHRRESNHGTWATLAGMSVAAAVTHLARKRFGENRAMLGGMTSGLITLGASYATLQHLSHWEKVEDISGLLPGQEPAKAKTAEEYDRRAAEMPRMVIHLSKNQKIVRNHLAERPQQPFGTTSVPDHFSTDFKRQYWHIHTPDRLVKIIPGSKDPETNFINALRSMEAPNDDLVADVTHLLYQDAHNSLALQLNTPLLFWEKRGLPPINEKQEHHILLEDGQIIFRSKLTQVYRSSDPGHSKWRVESEMVYVNGEDGCTIINGKPQRVK